MVELELVLLEAPLEAPLEEQVEAPLFQAWVPGNRGLYANQIGTDAESGGSLGGRL
jgi:hypothetical protein